MNHQKSPDFLSLLLHLLLESPEMTALRLPLVVHEVKPQPAPRHVERWLVKRSTLQDQSEQHQHINYNYKVNISKL
jgi:hypothetical protein